jgi:HEXXH motif-containing protein
MTGRHLVLSDGPESDPRAFRAAYARYLASCIRELVTLGPRLPEALRDAHDRVAGVVRRALAIDEGRLLHCFASPAVGTPLRCLGLRDDLPEFRDRIDTAAAALLPNLLFELALRGLLLDGETVAWEHGAPTLCSLAVGGELIPPAGATALAFATTHVAAVADGDEIARLPLDDDGMRAACEAPGGFRYERRYWPIGEVTHFATVDQNPIAAFEAHPDKRGNTVDLGDRPETEWIDVLEESFALVETFLPSTFAEMRLALHEVVPVGYDAVRHLSASYREAIGTTYLTLHPNVITMTEAVVHEFQHNKINVAAYEADFLENAFHPLYPSPVRPDPRPLWGILLAVHAFLPVAELYRRMRDAKHPFSAHQSFDARLSEIDLKNHEGMEMLRAHARFTLVGRALFGDLEALETRHLAERTARGLSNVATQVHLS